MRISGKALCAMASVPLVGCMTGPPPSPSVPPVTGTIETPRGLVKFELDVEKAPLGAANFRRYVEAGLYDAGSFYRATNDQPTSHGTCCITIVQGGRLGEAMRGSPDQIRAAVAASPYPPLPHEGTEKTGLRNRRGAMAYGRGDPGSATSEFFVSLADNPALDAGGGGHPDGYGYSVFGRITSGLGILDSLVNERRDAKRGAFADQILAHPLPIIRITLDDPPQ